MNIPWDDEVKFILGRPSFVTGPIAHRLRYLGHDIARKMEEEQAYVLHWMLSIYMNSGTAWRDIVDNTLKGEASK